MLVPSPGAERLEKIHWVSLGVSGAKAAAHHCLLCGSWQVTGMPYLHFVLGPTIARVFEEKKYVELDPGKVEIKDVG